MNVTERQRRCAAYINKQLDGGADFNMLLADCLHSQKLIPLFARTLDKKDCPVLKIWPGNAGWWEE